MKLAFDEQEMMIHCLGWETATNLALALHDAQCDLNAGKIKRWRPLFFCLIDCSFNLTLRKYDMEKKTCKKFRLLKRLAEDELCVAEVMDLTFSNGTVDFVTLR